MTWNSWNTFYDSRAGYASVWLLIYASALALASTLFFYEIPLPKERLTLSKVAFIPADASIPGDIPPAIWTETTLPDTWQDRNPAARNVWYQAEIELNVPPNRLWGVLIPALKMNAAVFLNGELLGNGGRFSDPVARNWMTPLLFTIPNGLLHPGTNKVHIRVKSDPAGSGQLSALHFGPYHELTQAYDTHYMIRITIIQIITTMLFIMGGLIAILWIYRREESYYGIYALAVTIWGLHNFNIFVTDIPISTRTWDWFTFITIGYYSFLSVMFIHRFLGVKRPEIEIPVLAAGVPASLALVFPDDVTFYNLAYALWYPAIFAVGLYVLVYICIHAWKRRSMELQFLATAGATTLLYALHDLMVMHGLANWEDGYYIQYAAAVLLSVFSFILLYRFLSSLNQLDLLNRELEKRIQEKHRQLESNYNKLRQLEHEQIVARERERMTRDIHDGMGGNLVSTLAMIESGPVSIAEIKNALRGSLDDLRLMIDSMDVMEDDLATVLGMFRMRITPRLKHSHISLEWDIGDIPSIPDFGPREALHILRILQETFTNIIKHANASMIRLSAHQIRNKDGQPVIRIKISDNGTGMIREGREGHGLRNMLRRAHDINAALSFETSSSGTTVILDLPLPEAPADEQPGASPTP